MVDNVLKNAIRLEIESFMKEHPSSSSSSSALPQQESIPAASSSSTTPPAKKKTKTEGRLSNLLQKIRSREKWETRTTKQAHEIKKKTKKLQIRYERFDDTTKEYKLVRQKDGGGARFLDINVHEKVTFCTISYQAQKLYFDCDNKNNYGEEASRCMFSIHNICGETMLETDDLWDYLKRKGVLISKTLFTLRSKYFDCDLSDNESTCDANSVRELDTEFDLPQSLPSQQSSEVWICSACSCTYIGSECLICKQNNEYSISLEQDSILNQSSHELFPDLKPFENTPTAEEVRTLRVSHFTSLSNYQHNTNISEENINNTQNNSNFLENTTTAPNNFQESITVKINRLKIKDDLIKEFQHEKIKFDTTIDYFFVNPYGEIEKGVGSGVDREVYSMFWDDVADSLLIGEAERVPYVRHDLFVDEWIAIGKILVKGFKDTLYFPTILSKSFLAFVLFGEVANDDLISSFLLFLSYDERELIKNLLNSSVEEEFQSDELYEFLDQFKVRTRVTKENFQDTISEIARQELIQKPHIMATCWKTPFEILKKENNFSSKQNLDAFYDQMKPTTKKVINLIKAEPSNDAEKDSLKFFKRYIRGLDNAKLKKLLRFLTGSDIIVVGEINIMFIQTESEFSRRPIAHTCTPYLELPTTYNSYCELREEFSNILNSNFYENDIV